MTTWPDPNASHAEVSAFLQENAPPPAAPAPIEFAPPLPDGTVLVCHTCPARVGLNSEFCPACLTRFAAAGVPSPAGGAL